MASQKNVTLLYGVSKYVLDPEGQPLTAGDGHRILKADAGPFLVKGGDIIATDIPLPHEKPKKEELELLKEMLKSGEINPEQLAKQVIVICLRCIN